MVDKKSQVVQRWDGERFSFTNDVFADEHIIDLLLNGEQMTSLLASRQDLEALCLGHFRTEFSVDVQECEYEIHVSESNGCYSVDLTINIDEKPMPRKQIVTSSCGACDKFGLPEAVAKDIVVDNPLQPIHIDELLECLGKMQEQQILFQNTGGVHAAALFYSNGDFMIREDIGRHNAVDKVIGMHILQQRESHPVGLLLSGRCGWDIVAKAAQFNIPCIAAIGAVSQLAADVARRSNISVLAFAREGKATAIGPVEGRFQAKH